MSAKGEKIVRNSSVFIGHSGGVFTYGRSHKIGLENKVMRECCFVVKRDAWIRGEFTLSLLDVLQGFSSFLQIRLTLILATLDGLDVSLLGDVIALELMLLKTSRIYSNGLLLLVKDLLLLTLSSQTKFSLSGFGSYQRLLTPYSSLRDKDLQESKDPQVIRIEQYFLMTDYSLWEVILNGDSPIPTRVIDGVVQPVAPTTAEQRLARKNEFKARVEKKFGGNKETKKVQKTLLKKQYENFIGSSSKSLDQIHD
nr:hypothetical protein [Tanacetum cinerariifolium]GEV84235.1 hypothetical protein [Tanacetum cinerariifolium]